MIRSVIGAFAGAAAVTALSAPLVHRAMVRWEVMDIPNHRSSHRAPTPRGGGVACLAGVVAGQALARDRAPLRVLWPALSLSALGFLDDRLGLSPAPRLLGQLGGGIASAVSRGPLDAVVGLMAFPVIVNVVNFMDGINGITGMTVGVWGLNAALVAHRRADRQLATLGAITAGAALGFLPANIPHADLFLGDVGSYLFGGLIAGGIVLGVRHNGDFFRLAAPGALYLADAAQAIRRRHQRGQPLTEAHREHIYQRLVDEDGLSHVEVALFHSGLAAIIGGAASALSPVPALFVCAIAAATYLAAPGLLRRTVKRTIVSTGAVT